MVWIECSTLASQHTLELSLLQMNGMNQLTRWGYVTVWFLASYIRVLLCVIQVRPGMNNSYEQLLHAATENSDYKDLLLLFRSQSNKVQINRELVNVLSTPRLERYIGVIYRYVPAIIFWCMPWWPCRPDTERASHYSKSTLTQEYDAVIFIDEVSCWKVSVVPTNKCIYVTQTTAVEPLDPTTTWQKDKLNLAKRAHH
jgi:hypothetical protein